MEMIKKIFKLSKALLRLSEVITDKATLICDGDLLEGVEVFVEENGELVPAPDGEYFTETQIINVVEGKVTSITDKPVETETPTESEETLAEETTDEPTTDERDARIAELEAKVAELESAIAERDARIAELEEKLNAANVEMAKNQKPAFEELNADEEKFENLSISEKIARLKKEK